MNEYLITPGSFGKFKVISSNINSARELEPYILETQIADLRPLLGVMFYYDLIKNQNEERYQKLLRGCDYSISEDQNFPVQFLGIEAYLCYKTYARFVVDSNVKSTVTGFKKKLSEDSEHASFSELQKKSDNANSIAKIYECDIRDYLFYNRSLYPVIEASLSKLGCEGCGSIWSSPLFKSNQSYRPRTTAVG